MTKKNSLSSVFLFLLSMFAHSMSVAQLAITPPEPDSLHPNVFYGAIPFRADLPPDIGESAPVLVFVHGLSGTAMNWWTQNDMYISAYLVGVRTAYISLNADNTPNRESIEANAEVLEQLLPHIADHFNTDKLYLIGHSKGGVDIQAAMLDSNIAKLVKAVFTISSPNQGTELADWAFEHPDLSEPLNLLNPAVESLQTAEMEQFRNLADPVLRSYGIPFFTIAGESYTGNPLTAITGSLLRALVPGIVKDTLNDGFVTVARARLADDYSANMGTVPNNHFETDSGSVSFAKIWGRIQGIEQKYNEFDRVASGGFSELGGDLHNSWIWSAKWYKGKLYVGTGREINCVSILIADVNTGSSFYPLQVISGQCPDISTLIENLGAEIWRFTPETEEWERVFKSPNTVPVAFDAAGNPTTFTARDVGFRGMEVFTEADGTESLYVGGVTSGSVFDPFPFEKEDGFPPPRLLRTVDGTNWQPVPQNPGTFLGEIGNILADEKTKFRAFRSLKAYKGKLFITVSDFVGSGIIAASSDPSKGDDAWQQVSGTRDEFPVWTLTVFNDFLYATTGLTTQQDPGNPGYGVYKTDAEGDPPYSFTPIVVNGGEQSNALFRSPNGLSFAEFGGRLYMGTNRPTELIRINRDDTWDLVVGEPRDTSQGHKAPLSGFSNGFANMFNGHFWRMASYNDHLYLGSWDWSSAVQGIPFLDPLDKLFTAQYGFDLFRSDDGIHWTAVTRTGSGFPFNSGVRSLEPTPFGLFLGTAGEEKHGAQVYRTMGPEPETVIVSPKRLEAASEASVGNAVELSWEAIPGVSRYRVYRVALLNLLDILQPQSNMDSDTGSGSGGVLSEETVQEVLAAAADSPCNDIENDTTVCAGVQMLTEAADLTGSVASSPYLFPLPYQLVAVTSEPAYSGPEPVDTQSIYFVRAEDSNGNVSTPSNIVAAPSRADPPSPLLGDLDADSDVDRDDMDIILAARNTTASSTDDPLDMDGDGMITVIDARLLALECTRPRCATN